MAQPVRLHRYSFRDYLVVEEDSKVKHEFLDGEIYAMAGGSPRHAALAARLIAVLDPQLRGKCRLFSSDLRVRVQNTGLTSYPDVTAICGPSQTDPESKDVVTNPTLVVEVLSPATIDFDLGEKFEHYRQIASLRTAIYVWQDRQQIEVRERQDDGSWRISRAAAGQDLVITQPSCSIEVNQVYTDILEA